MTKRLHIVSFNVPWPADYGGVIDVFYRIKALSEAGVRISLHCYTYGRPAAKELEAYCAEVHYYRRHTLPHNLLTREPYIVSSRRNRALLRTLLRDDDPVLLEGLHCCWLLPQLRQHSPSRLLLVRAHNVEHSYYDRLACSEPCWARRIYLRIEARKLQTYEPVLRHASNILSVTKADSDYFTARGYAPIVTMPSSHGQCAVTAPSGKGEYVLFQGDLSVADNQRAALFLLEDVFRGSSRRLVVAGRQPSRILRQRAEQRPLVSLVANPDDEEMARLMRQAHVCILFTNQATGLKLKLLRALYGGRFCLVNSKMVEGTPLGDLCTVADTPQAMRDAIEMLFQQDFTDEERIRREGVLRRLYSDQVGAQTLVDLLARRGVPSPTNKGT